MGAHTKTSFLLSKYVYPPFEAGCMVRYITVFLFGFGLRHAAGYIRLLGNGKDVFWFCVERNQTLQFIRSDVSVHDFKIDTVHLGRPGTTDMPQELARLRLLLSSTVSFTVKRAREYKKQRLLEFQNSFPALVRQSRPGLFLTYRPPHGGLGNFMFEFATFLGCARKNGRIPVIFTAEPRMENFEGMFFGFVNQSDLFPDETIDKYTIGESGPAKFTSKFHELRKHYPNQTVALTGYGQSWRYFHEIADEVRIMYTLKESVQTEAVNTIINSLSLMFSSGNLSADVRPVLVGIHVRRGDIVHEDSHRRHGHIAASEEYLLRAALRIQAKYKQVAFFVLSDDVEYSRKLFRGNNFVFGAGKSAEADMALMKFMEVMVVSVGTYGWWGAYLSNATDIYYFKNWPRNGSSFQTGVAVEDYFLPNWEGAE